MLSVILLLLLLPPPRVRAPLPDSPPQNWVSYGCTIDSMDMEGVKRWPLAVWADIRGAKPAGADPGDDPAMAECKTKHPWCYQLSMEPSRKKAQKDCDRWMDEAERVLKTMGPR